MGRLNPRPPDKAPIMKLYCFLKNGQKCCAIKEGKNIKKIREIDDEMYTFLIDYQFFIDNFSENNIKKLIRNVKIKKIIRKIKK